MVKILRNCSILGIFISLRNKYKKLSEVSLAGFLADTLGTLIERHTIPPSDRILERQTILDCTFAELLKAFTAKLPLENQQVLHTFAIEPENMLMLAAGARGLGRLAGKGELAPFHLMSKENPPDLRAVYFAATCDPLHKLHNHMPIDAIRDVSAHIDAWEVGNTPIQAKKLRKAASAIRGAIEEISKDTGITTEKELVIYDLHLTEAMCDILARLSENGNITSFALFRKTFSNMPVLNFLPAWQKFMEVRFGETYSSVSSEDPSLTDPSLASIPSPT